MSLVRKLFFIAFSLCLGIPLVWIISYNEPDLVHVANVNWLRHQEHSVRHYTATSRPEANDTTFQLQKKRYFLQGIKSGGKRNLDTGVLVVCKVKTSKPVRQVQYLLTAQRIKHEIYVTSSYTAPDLVDVNGDSQFKGKYSLVIVVDLAIILLDETMYGVLQQYCSTFGAAMILVTSPLHKTPTENVGTNEGGVHVRMLSSDKKLNHLLIHEKPTFKYLRDGGEMQWKRDTSELRLFELSLPYNSADIQSIVSVQFTSLQTSTTSTLPVALVDWKGSIAYVNGYVGLPLVSSIGKLALLEVINLISEQQGKSVLRFVNKRYVQIDVDDVFFAPAGFNPLEADIQEIIYTQEMFQQYLSGFKFNLGFCGIKYQLGSPAEVKGKEELVRNARLFNWFDHTYTHVQPHKTHLHDLIEVMKKNKMFALEQSIPLPNTQYSVSPHHSGVYPVYSPLFKAWKEVWNITVTSTEEYPHFKPVNLRRGFIHEGIKVLPRQTCGIYTHTNHFSDLKGGRVGLINIAEEGEVFINILNNPVSIFMTHYNNYGSDRLALELFKASFSFIKKWTKLDLKFGKPTELAKHYFTIFAEDKAPLWTSPCLDKRHMDIWYMKNCSQLPSAIIVGPQKTGSTALHFFLKQHPNSITNAPTKHAFEEVQFYSSDYYYSKGIEWYMSFFPSTKHINDTTSVVFEKSATYFSHLSTPQRVYALNPKTKIVVILTDPIRRAYSWYQHMKSHQDYAAVKFNFSQVLNARKENGAPPSLISLRNHCLTPGLYHQHIKRWLEFFNPDQIHFVDGEELVDSPFSVLFETTHFLGLPSFDYQNVLMFSPRKGFYCVKSNQVNNHEICLGIGKGRHYPHIPHSSVKYLKKYYAHSNRMLYKLLLQLSRKLPTWLIRSFST